MKIPWSRNMNENLKMCTLFSGAPRAQEQTDIGRKRSEEYLVIIFAVKRRLEAIFLPRVHL